MDCDKPLLRVQRDRHEAPYSSRIAGANSPSTAALHDDRIMAAPAPKALCDACVAYSDKDLDCPL